MLNAVVPAMDVIRIARDFKRFFASQPGLPTNADIFELFQNDILAARKLGLGWQEIADEFARAGVHKKNGSLFTGPDIRIYSRRKLKGMECSTPTSIGDAFFLPPEFHGKLFISGGVPEATKQAQMLPSALEPENASGAYDDAVLRMLIRVDAVSSCRMDGVRASLEDMLELEARGVSNDSLGRKRPLLSVRRYVEALERFIPLVQQSGPSGLTSALIKQLQNAVTVQPLGGSSADHGTSNADSPRHIQNSMEEPAPRCHDARFEQISRCAQGDLPNMNAPILARIAIAHAQYDSLLPNEKREGRAGRLFLTLMLAAYGVNYALVSNVIELKKTQYVSALRSAQQYHKWEPLVFFLSDAVTSAAHQRDLLARALNDLPAFWRSQHAFRRGSAAQRALDMLPHIPLFTTPFLAKLLNVNATAANRAVKQLATQGIISESKGRRQGRVFFVPEAIIILNDPLNRMAKIS